MTNTWSEYITADPEVMVGKPVVRGTRLTVEYVLDLLAAGWTEGELLESFPQLSPEGLHAVFAFAADGIRDLHFFPESAQAR